MTCLPSLRQNQLYLRDELEHYLTSNIENVPDALSWWDERRTIYPCLLRMALD